MCALEYAMTAVRKKYESVVAGSPALTNALSLSLPLFVNLASPFLPFIITFRKASTELLNVTDHIVPLSQLWQRAMQP